MKVTRELYQKSPKPGHAVILGVSYYGTELERKEWLAYECDGRNDLPFTPQERYSYDNGRTWTEWQPIPEVVSHEGDRWDLFSLGSIYQDPDTEVHLGAGLRQTIAEKPERWWYYNHAYWGVSEDNGKTWSGPTQFRYENGAYRDPDNPLEPDFLNNNAAYPNGQILHSNGTIILACTAVNIPKDAPDTDPTGEFTTWDKAPHARNIGLACFLGRWDSKGHTCDWQMSNRVWVPLSVSSRGLQEAMPVELKDGRVLVVCRGSNTTLTPGRKWFSISEDGGQTLSEIQELKYDDGTRFYSPSSIHGFIRHSITGKLYWVANICDEPPQFNSPRHPLVMAEIDEAIPAVKRDTISVIDERQPGEGWGLSLSNFTIFENRETHNFEMYMSRYSPKWDGKEPQLHPILLYNADAYKYIISFN